MKTTKLGRINAKTVGETNYCLSMIYNETLRRKKSPLTGRTREGTEKKKYENSSKTGTGNDPNLLVHSLALEHGNLRQ